MRAVGRQPSDRRRPVPRGPSRGTDWGPRHPERRRTGVHRRRRSLLGASPAHLEARTAPGVHHESTLHGEFRPRHPLLRVAPGPAGGRALRPPAPRSHGGARLTPRTPGRRRRAWATSAWYPSSPATLGTAITPDDHLRHPATTRHHGTGAPRRFGPPSPASPCFSPSPWWTWTDRRGRRRLNPSSPHSAACALSVTHRRLPRAAWYTGARQVDGPAGVPQPGGAHHRRRRRGDAGPGPAAPSGVSVLGMSARPSGRPVALLSLTGGRHHNRGPGGLIFMTRCSPCAGPRRRPALPEGAAASTAAHAAPG